jgi:hypothetical protein
MLLLVTVTVVTLSSQFENKGKANVNVKGGRRYCTNKSLISLKNDFYFLQNAASVLLRMFCAQLEVSYLQQLFQPCAFRKLSQRYSPNKHFQKSSNSYSMLALKIFDYYSKTFPCIASVTAHACLELWLFIELVHSQPVRVEGKQRPEWTQ